MQQIAARGGATIDDIKGYMSGLEGKKMIENGDMTNGVFSAGQIIGLIHDIPSVQELFDRIVSEAREIMTQRLPGVVQEQVTA